MSASAEALEQLRLAFIEVLVAERKLRGRDAARPGELSMAQFRVLVWLLAEGDLAAGRLAEYSGMQPGTMTQMLDGLQRDGMVVRERSLADRRKVVVRLTDEGRAAAQARKRLMQRRWNAALADLGADDVASGTEVLTAIAAFIDAAARD